MHKGLTFGEWDVEVFGEVVENLADCQLILVVQLPANLALVLPVVF